MILNNDRTGIIFFQGAHHETDQATAFPLETLKLALSNLKDSVPLTLRKKNQQFIDMDYRMEINMDMQHGHRHGHGHAA
jgi:hypothetical protein